MLFQSTDQNNNNLKYFFSSATIKRPTEKQLHSWRSVEAQNLTKRMSKYGHTSTLLGDNMIIIGGAATEGAAKEESFCFSFNLKTQVCEKIQVTGRNPSPLVNHSTCYWKDNKLVVFGGRGNETSQSSEVGILTISEKQGGNRKLFFHAYSNGFI